MSNLSLQEWACIRIALECYETIATFGAIATTLTQPLDVIKTRAMNAKPGEFNGLWHIITYTAKLGPLGFFKGYVPAFVRLAPHTILTFVFLEQLRLNFGYLPIAQQQQEK